MKKLFTPAKLRTTFALGLGVLAVSLFAPQVFRTTSLDAVLNGRTITLRAPVDGRIQGKAIDMAKPGDPVGAGEPLFAVEAHDDRDTRQDMAVMKTDLFDTLSKITSATAEIEKIGAMRVQLTSQRDLYAKSVADRAAQHVLSAQATARATQDGLQLVKAEVDKLDRAAQAGAIDRLEVDRARQRQASASAAAAQAAADLAKAQVEVKSAAAGVNVLDGQNDVAYSDQKLHDLDLQLTTTTAERIALQAHYDDLNGRLGAETDGGRPVYKVSAASPAVVWRQLVAAGSDVVKGQEVLTLVDCTDLFVTARLSESEAGELNLGDTVTLSLNGRPGTFPGTVRTIKGETPEQSANSNAATVGAADRYDEIEIGIKAADIRQGDATFCSIGTGVRIAYDRPFAKKWLQK